MIMHYLHPLDFVTLLQIGVLFYGLLHWCNAYWTVHMTYAGSDDYDGADDGGDDNNDDKEIAVQ